MARALATRSADPDVGCSADRAIPASPRKRQSCCRSALRIWLESYRRPPPSNRLVIPGRKSGSARDRRRAGRSRRCLLRSERGRGQLESSKAYPPAHPPWAFPVPRFAIVRDPRSSARRCRTGTACRSSKADSLAGKGLSPGRQGGCLGGSGAARRVPGQRRTNGGGGGGCGARKPRLFMHLPWEHCIALPRP